MKYLRINLNNSIKLLESKRAIVFKPLVNFENALLLFQTDVFK